MASEDPRHTRDSEKLLRVALDTRKFEIELYWKRAAYFWVFTGAALAAYIAAAGRSAPSAKIELLSSCIGLVFSVAWYLVNRGSKHWQENWERHVYRLEGKLGRPLFKIRPRASTPWWHLSGPYPFSVSKINQLLSLFVSFVFLLLVAVTVRTDYRFTIRNSDLFSTGILALTIVALTTLVFCGRSGSTFTNKSDEERNSGAGNARS
jgi:hypothetical protein